MENNPLEQAEKEKNKQLDVYREKLQKEAEFFFNNKQDLKNKIDEFSLQVDALLKNGITINKEEILESLKKLLEIEDKDVFISSFKKISEPIMMLRITHANIFEKIRRERSLRDEEISLSEVLYMSLDEGGKGVHIHLAPSKELIKENGIGSFKKDVENGLIKLAEIVKNDENIKNISATSWIVARHPALLENLGFTVVGKISEEEKAEHYREETRPIANSFITREDFLTKYGNK